MYCNDHEEYGCEECLNERHKRCVDVVKANSLEIRDNYRTETEKIEGSAKAICYNAETLFKKKTVFVKETNLRVEKFTEIHETEDKLLN